MNIEFTKSQYEALVKIAYLGNWLIDGIRLPDDQIEKYIDIEQYIFSFAKEIGLERYIEYDAKLNKFFPTKEFEDDGEIEQYIDDYDEDLFWEELAYRLARRDFIKKYGEETVKKMSSEERLTEEEPFIEKYQEEFDRYGVERLEIKS